MRPTPFGCNFSIPMITQTLEDQPVSFFRLPSLSVMAIKLSSTSTVPCNFSRPGFTIAVRNRCSIASSLIAAKTEYAFHAERTHAMFLAGDVPRGSEPDPKWHSRLVKDRASSDAALVLAVRAN